MNYRSATADDISTLAAMNQQLIRDEGHRNRMSIGELEGRMRGWLQGDYQAMIIEDDRVPVGYALFKEDLEWWYLRQFLSSPRGVVKALAGEQLSGC